MIDLGFCYPKMRQTQVKLSFSIVFILILGIAIRTHFLFHSFIRNTLAHTHTHADTRQTFAKSSYSLTFFLIVWPCCSTHTLTRTQRTAFTIQATQKIRSSRKQQWQTRCSMHQRFDVKCVSCYCYCCADAV